ncbi:FtsX-like permease family protein, partial [Gemmatimonadota bacterium]
RVFVPGNRYPENEQLWQFYGQVLDGVKAFPGVRSAAGVLSLPISQGVGAELSFIVRGKQYEEGNEPVAGYQAATAGYFETIGIPLLQGRTFTAEDRDGNPSVAVVSKAFADRIFPGEDPVGQQISWSDDTEAPDFTWTTIVGVVGNTMHNGLDGVPRSEIYQPFEQEPWPFFTLVIDAESPEALAAPLRRVVMEADPLQPVTHIATMRGLLHDSLARRRFNMILMSLFAALSLLLAAVGLYGVLSYTVAQRGREIGIRMALGADAGRVVGQFLQEGVRLLGHGIVIGILGALALTWLTSSLVHGIRVLDPASFAGGVIALGLIALLACWLPALRAARTDPMTTLRRE